MVGTFWKFLGEGLGLSQAQYFSILTHDRANQHSGRILGSFPVSSEKTQWVQCCRNTPRVLLAQTDPSLMVSSWHTSPCLLPLSREGWSGLLLQGLASFPTNNTSRPIPCPQGNQPSPRGSQGPRTSWLQIFKRITIKTAQNKTVPSWSQPKPKGYKGESKKRISWKEPRLLPGPGISRIVAGISERMVAGGRCREETGGHRGLGAGGSVRCTGGF